MVSESSSNGGNGTPPHRNLGQRPMIGSSEPLTVRIEDLDGSGDLPRDISEVVRSVGLGDLLTWEEDDGNNGEDVGS